MKIKYNCTEQEGGPKKKSVKTTSIGRLMTARQLDIYIDASVQFSSVQSPSCV